MFPTSNFITWTKKLLLESSIPVKYFIAQICWDVTSGSYRPVCHCCLSNDPTSALPSPPPCKPCPSFQMNLYWQFSIAPPDSRSRRAVVTLGLNPIFSPRPEPLRSGLSVCVQVEVVPLLVEITGSGWGVKTHKDHKMALFPLQTEGCKLLSQNVCAIRDDEMLFAFNFFAYCHLILKLLWRKNIEQSV